MSSHSWRSGEGLEEDKEGHSTPRIKVSLSLWKLPMSTMTSELDVIRGWLTNMFKTVEGTEQVEIADFRFDPFRRRTDDNILITGNSRPKSLAVLKTIELTASVKGELRNYSLVVKVLPTDDKERYTARNKFRQLLKFNKEVQVYLQVVKAMYRKVEKCSNDSSTSLSPPLPRFFFGQVDALNDCLVLENLEVAGFTKLRSSVSFTPSGPVRDSAVIKDSEHCHSVLRSMSQLHALSTALRNDSKEEAKESNSANSASKETWPFVVEAAGFRDCFKARMAPIKEEMFRYLKNHTELEPSTTTALNPNNTNTALDNLQDSVNLLKVKVAQLQAKVEEGFQELFWQLLDLRARPRNDRGVMVHGALNLNNILFRYSDGSPVEARFTDMSRVSVASPSIDISYFLHSSVLNSIIKDHLHDFLQVYHSHYSLSLQQLGHPGPGINIGQLNADYKNRESYGILMSCLVKTAEFVLVKLEPQEDENANKVNLSPPNLNPLLTTIAGMCQCPDHQNQKPLNPQVQSPRQDNLREIRQNKKMASEMSSSSSGRDTPSERSSIKRMILGFLQSPKCDSRQAVVETPRNV